MSTLIFACNCISAVLAMGAAYYWYQSSVVTYPSELRGITPIGGMTRVSTNPLLEAVAESGRLNKIAARWSAAAAMFAGVSAFLNLGPSTISCIC